MTNRTLSTLRRRLAREEGWAVLTALLLMAVMLASAIALARLVDNQTRQSGAVRNRETAFNLGESALNAQVASLTRSWSYVPAFALPACGGALPAAGSCPSDASLRSLFPTSDASGATWRTEIRDNAAPYTSFYSDALLGAGYPAYDANHDDRVWVRATATARGRTRTIVALVRAQQEPEDVVHTALVTGSLDLRNSGNKVVVDAGATGTVDVQCTPTPGETTPCLGYAMKSNQTLNQLLTQVGQQIQPTNVNTSYTGGLGLTQEATDRLKTMARISGTYYDQTTGCPTSFAGTVWLAGGLSCTLNNNVDVNSAAQPGYLIVESGTLTFRGTATYYGLVIHLNTTSSSGTLIDLNGDTCIRGAVLVAGPGTTTVGSSGKGCSGAGFPGNISYDPSAFGQLKTIQTAGIVQNSWRELRSR